MAAAACLPMVATQEEGCGCQRLRSLWGGRGEEEINRDFSCMDWSKKREKRSSVTLKLGEMKIVEKIMRLAYRGRVLLPATPCGQHKGREWEDRSMGR